VSLSKIAVYGGNYSQFERERALQLALQQATWAKQQRQIAHLTAFVDRFRAKATKAKQAQSRIKALERMKPIASPMMPRVVRTSQERPRRTDPARCRRNVVSIPTPHAATSRHAVKRCRWCAQRFLSSDYFHQKCRPRNRV
jgi:ATPase subunit of ABC transporter with duplicated ATPase domains